MYDQFIAAGLLMNQPLLEGALEAPFSGLGDEEFFPTLYEKAGRLAFGICQAHAFQDGNKRLAWLATVVFLEVNGVLLLDVEQDEAAYVIRSVADGKCGHKELTMWLIRCAEGATPV